MYFSIYTLQVVCVTRFDQSECVMCRVIFALAKMSRFQRCLCALYMVKFSLYSKLVRVISTLYGRGKLLEHLILIVVTLLLHILLSWAFVTSLNWSVMCRSPWWFECCFCRSSCIHCWLLLAVLSGYFGHLVTSTFLLCKFWGLHGSTPVSFPVMSRWKCIGIKTHSRETGWNSRLKLTCRRGSRREASNAKSRKSLFHFKPEKVNKFEYCNNLWKQNNFRNPMRKLKAWL